jgi:quercetin dioxygenase-like cupin family protein
MKSLSRHVATHLFIAGALAAALPPAATAHEAHDENVTPVLKQALPEVPGKLALIATVEFGPGESARPHLHPGSLVAYVLEGQVVSQLEGAPPVTYSQGQAWYEPPRVHHLVTRNPSATHRVVLLVWAIAGEGEPIKSPLPVPPDASH